MTGLATVMLTHLVKIILVGILLTGLMGLLGLTTRYVLLFDVIYLITIPLLLRNKLTEGIEYTKFIDVGNYMEQLLYSFRRHSKIGSALEDTVQIFPSGPMEESIMMGIEHINESCTVGNAYEEALGLVEVRYQCTMLERIHKFLVGVEMMGGSHLSGVDLLIVDRNKWVNRILEGQKGKVLLKRNMTLATFLSLAIVGSTLLMIPDEFKSIHTTTLAQCTTLGVVTANYLLWLYVQYKLTGSYIYVNNSLSEDMINKYKSKLEKNTGVSIKKTMLMMIFIIIGGFSYYKYRNTGITVGILIISVVCLTQNYRSRKYAIKRLGRELMKVFPDWMLTIALQLQSDNVQVSIASSVDSAPVILRDELNILVDRLEENPLGIEPFVSFYESLELQELESAMKMLYVMNQYGEEEMSQQIETLVERNSILQDKGEQLKLDDFLAGMGFFVLLPMLLGAMKMLVDMMLLVTNLLAGTAVMG